MRSVMSEILADGELLRVCEHGKQNKPDFRSGRHAIEVKAITSAKAEEFLNLWHLKFGDGLFHAAERLTQTWAVIVELANVTDPHGAHVATPRVSRLMDRLVPLLETLEGQGLTDMNYADDEISEKIRHVICSRSCSVVDKSPWGPGIVFTGYGMSHTRSRNIEHDVADTLRYFLSPDRARNLYKSLAHERTGVRRIGVFYLADIGPALPIVRSLNHDHPGDVVPTSRLDLHGKIDAVFAVTPAGQAIGFDAENGWRRYNFA